jgi:hypothetical protein
MIARKNCSALSSVELPHKIFSEFPIVYGFERTRDPRARCIETPREPVEICSARKITQN